MECPAHFLVTADWLARHLDDPELCIIEYYGGLQDAVG